jgi:hypothetical protein
MVLGQSRQKVPETPFQTIKKKAGHDEVYQSSQASINRRIMGLAWP